jgi:hypothetical protein
VGTPSAAARAAPTAELRHQYSPHFGANTVIYNDLNRKWNAFDKAPYDPLGFNCFYSSIFF